MGKKITPKKQARGQRRGGGQGLALLIALVMVGATFMLMRGLSGGDGKKSASSAAPSVVTAEENSVKNTGEYRAVWFSYLDLQDRLQGKTEMEFTNSINSAFDNCVNMGLNTVIVQVRPFSDALYQSQLFPSSQYITGKQGDHMAFDPLAVMVQSAHDRGLTIEAWVNPYRISGTEGTAPCAENPGYKWFADEQTKNDWVVQVGEGLYYNPAIPEVQQLIVDGVAEIVKNYQVDGIHFDDYFYPSGIDDSFDAAAYSRYTAAGGTLARGDFRRQNVDTLVKQVYQTVHSLRSDCTFGISPQGNVDNCYDSMYSDVKTWCAQKGYIDYIAPQIYWGYEHPLPSARFDVKISEWNAYMKEPSVKLYIGLAAYRVGDSESGFTQNGDDLARMVKDSRTKTSYSGFILFRYDNLAQSGEVVGKEMLNLQELLQDK